MAPRALNEQRYRDAESRLWRSFDLAPTERRLRLERSDISIRVQEVGSGPPVIFVHGASNGGASWSPLVAGLAEYQCVLVDRPGCALSEPLKEPFDDVARLEEFADGFIADVLDSLELDTALVVATSLGGYLVLRSAAAHPKRIQRMVEFGWSVGAPIDKMPVLMRLALVAPIGRAMTRIRPTKSMVRSMFRQIGLREAMNAGRVSDEMIDWFLALLRDTNTMRNELDAGPRLADPLRGMNQDILLSDAVLASIKTPVMFMWGTNDLYGGAEVAGRFTAKIPTAELELVDGAGHAPWIDNPEHAARSVRAVFT